MHNRCSSYCITSFITQVENVLEAILQYELVSVDGEVVLRNIYNRVCISSPDLCSLPAGVFQPTKARAETHQDKPKLWVGSAKLPPIPPFFKNRTYKGRVELFNEKNIMFLCGEVVGKIILLEFTAS
ncbi:hypothetical protein pdam_00019581 [Pocillopora damicornis]|uniref:Uncharacterized protein n=1 Tax=Pocillopora damicornis TaxID=46731 RepID=A0A3M6UQT9_POCDA|nr:hypothetical protein pdam_00019581 [Pocillopora damicornis]